ncbi:MFS transporter [Alteromonas sediminis]
MKTLSSAHIALIAVCCGYLIAPMGLAAVNVAIPALAADLGATASEVGWLPTLYMLGSVAFMLPCGKLADRVGRKKVYTAGLILNLLTTALCAMANSVESIIFWRFVQGIAASMIFATGIAIVSSVTPFDRRGKALGIVASCVYIGLTAAPAMGGFVTDLMGWRAVFYIQIPLLSVLIGFVLIKLKGEWKGDTESGFDWFGSLLFMAFSGALVFGLARLPQVEGWLYCIGSLIALCLFIFHQDRSRKPLIRLSLFRESRVFSLSLSAAFFMYASNFAVVFLLSLYLQYIKGLSPSEAGTILLVQALCMAIVAPVAGVLADRFQARIIASAGCILVAIGFVLLTLLDQASPASSVVIALLVIGIGFGLFSTPNNSAIMGAVRQAETGVASASMNLARTIGNLLGMSLVNFLINRLLGDIPLEAAPQAQLMVTIENAMMLSLVLVVFGIVVSIARGRESHTG